MRSRLPLHCVCLVALLGAAPLALASSNDAGWIADIDNIVHNLPRLHKNAFFHVSQEDFESAAATLKSAVPSLTDHEVTVGIMKLVALIGDAHTSVSGYRFSRYPIGLYWFSDGLFVIRATADHEDLIGARLIAVNDHPIEEITAAVASVISHENDAWLRALTPDALTRPEILHALGIIPSASTAHFTFSSGEDTIERDLLPLPADVTPVFVDHPSGDDLPLYLRKPTTFYWYAYLPREQTLYLQYNVCRDIPGRPFTAFLNEVEAFAEENVIDRFVLDLRLNTGGNSAVLQPLISAIQAQPQINRADRLFVLIGRRTFSSALLNSIQLRQQTNATFLGEPTGGKPNAYGEVQSFVLPSSGLTVTYSIKYFLTLPGEDPPSFVPDRYIPLGSQDYFAGRDPVLSSALPVIIRRRAVAK